MCQRWLCPMRPCCEVQISPLCMAQSACIQMAITRLWHPFLFHSISDASSRNCNPRGTIALPFLTSLITATLIGFACFGHCQWNTPAAWRWLPSSLWQPFAFLRQLLALFSPNFPLNALFTLICCIGPLYWTMVLTVYA